MPGANLWPSSGVTRTTVTEADGSFRLPAINPGRYTVTAELSGFTNVEVTDIEMSIGLGLTQNFTMPVQSVTERVTVTGVAPVVDTTKSEVSGDRHAAADRDAPDQLAAVPVARAADAGDEHGLDAPVLCDGQRRRIGDLQLDRQHRRRRRQQLRRRRRAAPEPAGRRGRRVQGQQRAIQGRVGPCHRRHRAGGDQVRHQQPARHRLRVLPRQGAQRQGGLRDGEARVPAAPVRRQRRRTGGSEQDPLLRRRRAHAVGRVLHGGDRGPAVLLRARGHVRQAVHAQPVLRPRRFPINIPYIDVSQRGDTNNIAPRAGAAWDVAGTGRTVVRGGYGLYYGHVRILGNLTELRNYQQFSVNITNPVHPDPYGGRDPATFIVSAPANITVVANDYVQPSSHQFNAGFSHRLFSDYSIHIDGVVTNTNDDRKIVDINARVPGAAARPNPTFARVDQNRSTGEVRYRALYAKLEKRFSRRHQFMVTYTNMHSRDNNPLNRYLDPFTADIDWGPSSGERRHALVASGSVLLPLDVTLGAVWSLRSQLPWNATAGRDLNADGFNTDLVPGTTRNSGSRDLDLAVVNTWRASNGRAAIPDGQIESSRINLLDVRASKAIRLGATTRIDLMAQAFNLFDTDNLQAQYGGGRVTNALSNGFGRILTARPGRQAELAVRLLW